MIWNLITLGFLGIWMELMQHRISKLESKIEFLQSQIEEQQGENT